MLQPHVVIPAGQPLTSDAYPYNTSTNPDPSLATGNRIYELTNHLGNVLATVTDKKIAVSSDGSLIDSYKADVVTAQDYYPFGMQMPGRTFALAGSAAYRYGFNGKEKDDEVKGAANQIDYGMRVYDPRAGRFMSVDPLTGRYPFYTPYEYAGNSPIKFVDLDGEETYDPNAPYWRSQPLFDISKAPARGYNAAGIPRNANWFFKQQLAAKPEMFSEDNKVRIKARQAPEVDETWVKFNPEHAGYEGEILIHHHVDGGEMVAAIPEQMHFDKFSELHPYVKALRGSKISGLTGGIVSVVGNVSWFSGLFSGDPDAWVNAFGYGNNIKAGDIKKDWSSGLYTQITSVIDFYTDVLDDHQRKVIDPQTGKPKQRLAERIVKANVYTGYVWDNDSGGWRGVNKVTSQSENWYYDEKGTRIKATPTSQYDIIN